MLWIISWNVRAITIKIEFKKKSQILTYRDINPAFEYEI